MFVFALDTDDILDIIWKILANVDGDHLRLWLKNSKNPSGT